MISKLFNLNSSNGKRAQMEMIGLVVIVILITLGMLFMARFALNDDPQKKVFTRKGLAYSTMSAVMKTSIPASNNCARGYEGAARPQLGKDILEDCAKNKDTDPEGYSLYRCEWIEDGSTETALHSCKFAENTIKKLLEETLGRWNKKYLFQVKLRESVNSEPTELFTINDENCGRERDTSGLFPISTEAGLIESVLYLCD